MARWRQNSRKKVGGEGRYVLRTTRLNRIATSNYYNHITCLPSSQSSSFIQVSLLFRETFLFEDSRVPSPLKYPVRCTVLQNLSFLYTWNDITVSGSPRGPPTFTFCVPRYTRQFTDAKCLSLVSRNRMFQHLFTFQAFLKFFNFQRGKARRSSIFNNFKTDSVIFSLDCKWIRVQYSEDKFDNKIIRERIMNNRSWKLKIENWINDTTSVNFIEVDVK